MRLRRQFGVQGHDEAPCFLVGCCLHDLPLVGIEGRGSKDGSRNRKAVTCEILKEAKRQRQRSHGPGCGGTDRFFDPVCFAANGLERVSHNRARTIRPGPGDKIHQLAPTHRRIVTVFGRLVEDGQQTIVKAHLLAVSFGRTLLSLYDTIYNALSMNDLTAP